MSSVNSSNCSSLGALGSPETFLVSEVSACAEMSLVIWAEVSACAEVRLVICSVKRSTTSTLSVLPRPSRHDLRK